MRSSRTVPGGSPRAMTLVRAVGLVREVRVRCDRG